MFGLAQFMAFLYAGLNVARFATSIIALTAKAGRVCGICAWANG